jgi:hypothetical protein
MTVLRLSSAGVLDTAWGVNGAATGVGNPYSDARAS